MTTTTIAAHAFTTKDIEYLRHGATPLLLRLYRPEGRGPFPVVVELHGGAWSSGDRTLEHFRHDALAQSGLAVASLDFRQGREGAYPLQVADINYAVRWVKAHAKELELRPDRVGISGQSSGGHLAMLVAMKPNDPRYAAIALPTGTPPVDASARCVVMSWPVINPLSRYRHALRESGRGAAWTAGPIQGHKDYWPSEADMADGNPVMILERGEKVLSPPALWIQTPNDPQHNYRDPDGGFDGNEPERFAARYRKAGGTIDVVHFDAPQRFTSVAPTSPAALDAFRQIAAFCHKHLA
jgi:acetyl esterase